jgi:hypothetical protein
MAFISIDYDIKGKKTIYKAVKLRLDNEKDFTLFATGKPDEDYNQAIDKVILSDDYHLLCSSDVHDFLLREDVDYEFSRERARVGHPFSFADYLRPITK